jgi:hypothetical protein
MSSKEQSRLAQQIGRCYAVNKTLQKPIHLTLCNLSEQSTLYADLQRVNYGFANYILKRTAEPIEQVVEGEVAKLVYLSPDAPEYLETVTSGSNVYVIGGLVDETVSKKVTLSKCEALSVRTCALPIEKYMRRRPGNDKTQSLYSFNKILAVNQVFGILASVYEHGDWRQALDANVPKRKGFFIE